MTDDPTTPPSTVAQLIASDKLVAGHLIDGRYRLDQRIGSGGMGSVWRAHDLNLGRDVALKLVALGEKLARMRFVREGKVAARLDHPGLCRVYDVGEHHGVGHLVMELLDGETVYRRMLRAMPPPSWRLSVIAEVARAMAVAHAQGLVHRDLKPDNLFLDQRNGRERTVVIDFGLAFLDGDGRGELGRLTASNITGGTPQYMAPEQARALAIGPPADVYAIGCVLFELMAARPPFEGQPQAVMSAQVFATPPRLADAVTDLEPGLDALVTEMLHKTPEERPTMTEVADRLDQLVARAATAVPGRHGSGEPRVHRALTRNLEAPSAMPIIPAIGALISVGPVPDDILVAAACAGLTARRATQPDVAALSAADPRAVILADTDEEALRALCALGPPVIGVAPVGDLELAARLARIGCADVLTRPIQAAVATRKILRVLRRRPASP